MLTIFTTYTSFDLRAITTLGVNSKPTTTNPIGYFGTGLKYAIAVLVRMGHKPRIYIQEKGKQPAVYEFYTKREEFRGKSFDFIYMRKGSKRKFFQKEEQLPYTTEFGKNWELWQVFRELYSNTLDEQGMTYVEEEATFANYDPSSHKDCCVRIMIEGAEFAEEYYNRDDTFLPDAANTQSDTNTVAEIRKGPGKFIYYRGMRVHEPLKPTLFTWNIVRPIDLTEDRTIKYSFQVDAAMMSALVRCKDREIVQEALNVDDQYYEHCLDYMYSGEIASSLFKELLAEKQVTHSNAKRFIRKSTDCSSIPLPTPKQWYELLAKALLDETYDDAARVLREYSTEILEHLTEEFNLEYVTSPKQPPVADDEIPF